MLSLNIVKAFNWVSHIRLLHTLKMKRTLSYLYFALSLILCLVLVSHVTQSVIQFENLKIWSIIFKNSSTFNHMTATYAIIKSCIQKTIDIINICDNSNQVKIAREFDVSMQRLQFRLKDHSSASAVQELHNRALKPDQKLALHTYRKRLNELSLSAWLNLIESADNLLLRQNSLWASLDLKWVKQWLNHQLNLHKAKRKSLTAARKNAHNEKLLKSHFDAYDEMIKQYDMTKKNTWNFNKIEYHMSIACFDWIITVDSVRRIYMLNSDNREFCTIIECINDTGKDISSMLILQKINLLFFHFNNDIDDDVIFTTSNTDYSNDWISLQWIKHFDHYSQRHQWDAWRLLVMNGYESYHTREFLFYCENHKIIPFNLPLHTTHLLQSLNVCVFQSLKHWHLKAVNEAIQTSDKIFIKIEFLAAFNEFRSTIHSTWKQTDLILFDSNVILNKMQETWFSAHFITSSTTKSLDIWKTISTTRLQLRKQQVSLLCFNYESELHRKLVRYTKEVYAMTCRIELLKNKLGWTQSIQNAWNACKKQSDKILQTEDLLYVKDAWTMTQDRVQVEELRQQTRDEREEKRYINDLKKVYKTIKSHRMKLLK